PLNPDLSPLSLHVALPISDVVEVVGQPPEVAAQVSDVAAHAIARRQWNVETAVGTALVAMVVARITVDEPVGDHEVHGMAGEGLDRKSTRLNSSHVKSSYA